MQLHQGLSGITIGATLALIAQPVWAAPVEVTAVRLNPTSNGVEVVFDTQGNDRAQVFTVSRGNSSVADITNTQLRLPEGRPFRQNNPAPGITSVVVSQLNENTVQVVVSGTTKAPTGEVIRRDGPGLVLSFSQVPGSEAGQLTPPIIPNQALPPSTGQRPSPVPPALPRAVAPPVGDIAIAPIDIAPDIIDLGTTERVPKLLLREAPVREVLTLLARAAGLNVAFTEGSSGATTGAPGEAAPASAGPTISLDVENESVQDVFNYVLRLSGLQASRVGQTIFVGQTLSGGAQNRIVRTFRLNQIRATASGTTTQTTTSRAETGGSVSSGTGAGGFQTTTGATAETAIDRQTTVTENVTEQGAREILQSYGANGGSGAGNAGDSGSAGGSATLLQGLEVVADARANTVTLIGTPRLVGIATDLLKQLDLRRRQVAVAVKIVDVDLSRGRNANSSLQFGAGIGSGSSVAASFINGIFRIGAPLGSDFLLNLLGSVEENSAKILTSPTLLVQEGSSAQVNLTEEVFSGVLRTEEFDDESGRLEITEEPIIRPSGVILNITVDRIDDNGFVTLNLSPEVSAPFDEFELASGTTGTLLQQRRLESGRMRLRDGQTLVLTGIIQDADRVEIEKVPILGDIPLLGRLFRRDENGRQRRELVVVVTPRILNDANQPSFGYQYSPGPEAEKLLNR